MMILLIFEHLDTLDTIKHSMNNYVGVLRGLQTEAQYHWLRSTCHSCLNNNPQNNFYALKTVYDGNSNYIGPSIGNHGVKSACKKRWIPKTQQMGATMVLYRLVAPYNFYIATQNKRVEFTTASFKNM